MIPTKEDINKIVVAVEEIRSRRKNRRGVLVTMEGDRCGVRWEGTRYIDRVHKSFLTVVEDQEQEVYTDPKDLSNVPKERLEIEGNRMGLQNRDWNDLFNLEVAVRNAGLSELIKWCIFSNRWLIMRRKDGTDEKLFTKEEVLKIAEDVANDMYSGGAHGNEKDQAKTVRARMKALKNKL